MLPSPIWDDLDSPPSTQAAQNQQDSIEKASNPASTSQKAGFFSKFSLSSIPLGNLASSLTSSVSSVAGVASSVLSSASSVMSSVKNFMSDEITDPAKKEIFDALTATDLTTLSASQKERILKGFSNLAGICKLHLDSQEVKTAFSILENVIDSQRVSCSYEESQAIVKALKVLTQKAPDDAFLRKLHQHLATDATRRPAQVTAYILGGMAGDARAQESVIAKDYQESKKQFSENARAQKGSHLPQELHAHLAELQKSRVFDMQPERKGQLHTLEILENAIQVFCSAEDTIAAQHTLSAIFKSASKFLENPSKAVQELKPAATVMKELPNIPNTTIIIREVVEKKLPAPAPQEQGFISKVASTTEAVMTIYNTWTGSTASVSEQAVSNPKAPGNSSSRFFGILDQVQSLASVGGVLGSCTFTPVIKVLRIVLAKAQNSLTETGEEKVSVILGNFLEQLNAVEAKGTWTELSKLLVSLKTALVKEVPFISIDNYIIGIEGVDNLLSGLFSTAPAKKETVTYEDITFAPQKEVKKSLPDEDDEFTIVKEDEKKKQKKELIDNLAQNAIMALIGGKFLGISIDNAEIIAEARKKVDAKGLTPKAASKAFRAQAKELFFQKAKEARSRGEISSFVFWKSQFCYWLFLSPLRLALKKLSNKLVALADQLAGGPNLTPAQRLEHFEKLQHTTAKALTAHFTNIVDAFSSIRDLKIVHEDEKTSERLNHERNLEKQGVLAVRSGRLEDQMAAELTNPIYNEGFTPNQLYQISKGVVDTILSDLLFSSFFKYLLDKIRIKEPKGMEKVFNSMVSLIEGIARAIIFIPDKILSYILLNQIKYWFLSPQTTQKILDSLVGLLGADDRGYTGASSTLIKNVLEDVLKGLTSPKADGEEAVNASNYEEKKKLLVELVRQFLPALKMSQAMTREDLRILTQPQHFKDQIANNIEQLFVPEVVNTIVELINNVYNTVLNSKQIEKNFVGMMQGINESYRNPKKEVKEEERENIRKTRNDIDKLLNQIFEVTLDSVIRKQFDFSSKKEELKEINDAVKRIQGIFMGMHAAIQNERDMNTLKEHLEEGKKALVEEQKKIRARGYSGYITEHFDKLEREGAKHLKSLSDALKNAEKKSPVVNLGKMEQEDNRLDALENSRLAFEQWLNSSQFAPIQPVGFNVANWTPLMDFIKSVVKSVGTKEVKKVFDFLTKPYQVKHLINRMMLIPLVKAQTT